MDKNRKTGRTIVITGGSSGIGKEMREIFTAAGDKVYVLSRSNQDGFARHIACDVTDAEAVRAAMEWIAAEAGGIDVLINNAGVGVTGAAEFLGEEAFRTGLDVNFSGVFYCSKYALPHMKSGGRILNVSSVCAFFALPFKEIYCAAKAGVNMLSYGLAMELKPAGISVCAVCPGDTKSGFSKSRIKDFSENPSDRYGSRMKDAAEKLDKKEDKRMPAAFVARKIVRIANKKRMPVMKIIGAKYKALYFLSKFIPLRVFLWFTDKKLGS